MQLILTDYVEVVGECFGDAAFVLSTWSLLCDGRLLTDVVILSYFLAGLRVHSVEGGIKRTNTTRCGVSQKEH